MLTLPLATRHRCETANMVYDILGYPTTVVTFDGEDFVILTSYADMAIAAIKEARAKEARAKEVRAEETAAPPAPAPAPAPAPGPAPAAAGVAAPLKAAVTMCPPDSTHIATIRVPTLPRQVPDYRLWTLLDPEVEVLECLGLKFYHVSPSNGSDTYTIRRDVIDPSVTMIEHARECDSACDHKSPVRPFPITGVSLQDFYVGTSHQFHEVHMVLAEAFGIRKFRVVQPRPGQSGLAITVMRITPAIMDATLERLGIYA